MALKENNEWVYLKGVCDQARNLYLEMDLEPGEYIVIGSLDWKNNVYDVNLSFYGSSSIKFERNRYKETPDVLNDILKYMGIDVASDIVEKPNYTQYICINLRDGFIIYSFENISKKPIEIKKNFNKLDREIFELIGVNDDYNITINIKPDEIKAITFRVKDIFIDINSNNYK